jgi:hypothetical protein
MSELIRLYYLVGFTNLGTDDRNGILNTYFSYRRTQQKTHEVQRFRLFFNLVLKMHSATDRKVSTRRVGYHQIPILAQQIPHVALIVWAWFIGG